MLVLFWPMNEKYFSKLYFHSVLSDKTFGCSWFDCYTDCRSVWHMYLHKDLDFAFHTHLLCSVIVIIVYLSDTQVDIGLWRYYYYFILHYFFTVVSKSYYLQKTESLSLSFSRIHAFIYIYIYISAMLSMKFTYRFDCHAFCLTFCWKSASLKANCTKSRQKKVMQLFTLLNHMCIIDNTDISFWILLL